MKQLHKGAVVLHPLPRVDEVRTLSCCYFDTVPTIAVTIFTPAVSYIVLACEDSMREAGSQTHFSHPQPPYTLLLLPTSHAFLLSHFLNLPHTFSHFCKHNTFQTQIDIEVDPDPRAAYFRQARNGLFIRMALVKQCILGS